MLVLARRLNERVMVGDTIIVTVVDLRSDKVRLGFDAPDDVPINREEIHQEMQRARGYPVSLAGVPKPSDPSDVSRLRSALRGMLRAHDGQADPDVTYRAAVRALALSVTDVSEAGS